MSGSSGDPNSHIHKHTYKHTYKWCTSTQPWVSEHGSAPGWCLWRGLYCPYTDSEPPQKTSRAKHGSFVLWLRVQSSGMVLACLVWCGEQLLHHSLYPRLFQFYHWKSVLQSPKTSFGVPAENPIISLTLTDIAGACNKPEVSAFAMLFETRIELALPCKLV